MDNESLHIDGSKQFGFSWLLRIVVAGGLVHREVRSWNRKIQIKKMKVESEMIMGRKRLRNKKEPNEHSGADCTSHECKGLVIKT